MPANKRVTIQDIAEKAQVSKSTVSRVLNDTTPVASEKERAVLAAMAELNYQPNIFARGLAGGQSMTIGILTQNVGSPFYDAIMNSIIAGFEGTNFSPIFADGRWQQTVEEKELQNLMARRVDGLIIVGGHLTYDVLGEIEEQVPIIIIARDLPEFRQRCVVIDNKQAAYQATQYLIEQGHRHIAHIMGVAEQQDAQQRWEGYAEALTAAGIAFNSELVVAGNFRRQAGVLAVETLLTRGQTFSAIFAANDQMAFGARLALFRRGIRVPDEVSLVGFDDQPDSSYMTPPLTTVRQPANEMGKAAACAMLKLLKDERVTLSTFATELIIRESVARFR